MQRQEQHRNNLVIKKLGSRIREIRLTKGYSQEELANLCNLELSQINRIELGKINTSVSHLFLIAEHLGVSAQNLLDFEL